MEIGGKEGAEMFIALTLLRMSLTAGNAFAGKPLRSGHRMETICAMSQECSDSLETVKQNGG